MTQEQLFARLEEAYGEAGIFAAESMSLTQADYDLGFDHCVEKIAPALEEELMVLGGDPPEWADEL